MRIPRVYLQANLEPDSTVDLPLQEAHHLVRVLRRRAGDAVLLLSLSGIFDGEIDDVSGVSREHGELQVRVRVRGQTQDDVPSVLPWTLGVGVVKGESFDLVVRMASELGVGRVVPLWTSRSVVRPGRSSRAASGSVAKKSERWARVAREAAKQCGRAEPLVVAGPCEFADFLQECSDQNKRWITVPAASARPGWMNILFDRDKREAAPATFLVGPEGGFTPAEVECAIDAGFESLGFPTPVLRTPTAVALIGALGVVVSSQGP